MEFAGTERLLLLALAAVIEAAVGYPDFVYRKIGHPVTWIGHLIAYLDSVLCQPALSALFNRTMGAVATGVLLLASIIAGITIEYIISSYVIGLLVIIVIVAMFMAAGSLRQHVQQVLDDLEASNLSKARTSVGRIVGRDTESLNESDISRAAIESLAENFSDGVIAPAFWFALFGLPGMIAYKAVNTADSMIGHRNERYRYFGWAAARLDDLLNLPASRISAILIVLAALLHKSASAQEAFLSAIRDAGKHRSPNAGWPEAAMAGALGLQLGGPRLYNGQVINEASMGRGKQTASVHDLQKALAIYYLACGLGLALIFSVVLIIYWLF